MSRELWPGAIGVFVFVVAVLGYRAWGPGDEVRSVPDAPVSERTSLEQARVQPEGDMMAAQSDRFPAEKMPTVLTPRDIHSRNHGENWREVFCDDANWAGLDLAVEAGSDGDFFVDGETWSRTATSTRVGLASFISECRGEGRAIRIRAIGEGALLAEYDASSGLLPANR